MSIQSFKFVLSTINPLIILLLLLCVCNPATKDCNNVSGQEAENVVTSFFNAITNNNRDSLKSLTTDGFLIYDNGAVWDLDSVYYFLAKYPKDTNHYELRDFVVLTDCNSALLRYSNDMTVDTYDSADLHFQWLESAYVIRNHDDKLKLAFLHATMVKE